MTSDNRRYTVPPAQSELALCQILQEAQHRWLRPTEVCEILHNYRKFKLTPDPPQRPQSGSLFLFDRKALRYFRKDGHNWRKKKDGKTVREAHERLKVGSVDVLHCYYAHGEDNENFQRRSYWLLEGAYEHIVLVHYREVKEANRTGITRTVNGYTAEALQSSRSSVQASASPATSPQSSLLVSPHTSPRASSPSISEWNGNTFSPEFEEIDSGDDDQCPSDLDLHTREQGSMLESVNGNLGVNARPLQSCASFSIRTPNGHVMEQQMNSSDYNANVASLMQQRVSDMTVTQKPSLNQGNGQLMYKELSCRDPEFTSRPLPTPGGFDLLELPEYTTCVNNLEIPVSYGGVEKQAGAAPWIDVLDHCPPVQHHDALDTVVSSSIGSPYNLGDSKAKASTQSYILGSMQDLMALPYQGGLEREPLVVVDTQRQGLIEPQSHMTTSKAGSAAPLVSSMPPWQAVFEQLGSNGQGQARLFGISDGKTMMNQAQPPQFQFNREHQLHSELLSMVPDDLARTNGSNIIGFSLSHAYPQVFKDFQADSPSKHDENENLKKLDSFGRWMNQEIGGDGENSLITVSSDSGTYWASPLDDQSTAGEVSSLSQQIQFDVGLSLSLSQEQFFSIVDFSPDYGSSDAETKVLVTGFFLKTPKDLSECKWCCMFGELEVPAEILQTGVLRCRAPPHSPGRVTFCITRNDRVACSEVREFEYRSCSGALNNSSLSNDGLKLDWQNESILRLQVRLARMLCSGTKKASIVQSPLEERSVLRSKLISLVQNNDEEWSQIEDCLSDPGQMPVIVKEELVQRFIKEKLQEWLMLKLQEDGKGASVLDDHGLGILHMGAALGYDWIIGIALAAGISINFRDSHGWTALHWAAFHGSEKTVVSLLAAGAAAGAKTDPTPEFPAGQTPSDLASSCGHKGIAGYLAESSLTSHLSSLVLKEGMMDNFSVTLAGEKAVETVSERSSIQLGSGGSVDQLSLQDSLAAVRNAAQAAARIQSAFRAHSFKNRQVNSYSGEDEWGISDEQARSIIACQKMHKSGHSSRDEILHTAAIRIQCKFRGWKFRRDFLLRRQCVVKIQAHVRGHQVRMHYRDIIWSVGIVEKALRWRRKGKGVRGACPDTSLVDATEKIPADNDEDDFLKVGRKQIEVGLGKALARVQSMVKSREARDQYRRLLESFQKTKGDFDESAGDTASPSENSGYQDFLMSITNE
eukprot:c28864_g1_i1 orf=423-4043(-)